MSEDRAKTLSKIFNKVIDETMTYQGKPRFALFSFPHAGALGEGIDQAKSRPPRTAEGKVIIKPRQIYGGHPRNGMIASSYFSKPTYVSIGAPYMEPDKIERQYQLKKKKKFPHDQSFIPASGEKSDFFPPGFKYEPQEQRTKRVSHRDADGKVIIGPRPFLTTITKFGHYASTVGHLLNRQPKFMPDPYSLKRDKEIKEWKENKAKSQKAAFLTTAHGNRPFSADKEIFDIKPDIVKKKPERSLSIDKSAHADPFYPSRPPRKGFNATIGPFPKYMECPPRDIKRQKEAEGQKKEVFRPNSAFLSRPTPSISLNKQNLKYEAARLLNTTL